MIDFIAKLISGDGVTKILLVVVLYVILLWALFSFWVYVDAKKRFKKTSVAIIFSMIVFVFNFPALVFYLITRPENEDDFVIFPADNLSNRGVNVPIVNFIGKDGKINLSFELKINNAEIFGNSDMAINVDWNSKSSDFTKEKPIEVVVEAPEAVVKTDKAEVTENKFKNQVNNSLKNVKNKVGGFKPRFNLPNKKSKDSQKPANS